MPELPEVYTTVEGLKKEILGKKIADVWSDFHIGTAHGERQTIKNKNYYEKFRKAAKGDKIKSVVRRGKNVLINLSRGYTIVVHMKMTGHLMVGKYKKRGLDWIPEEKGPLQDPYNKYLHLVFSLSNGKHLVLSDARKFASVTFSKTDEIEKTELEKLGPDALKISEEEFFERIKSRRNWPIKPALTDQSALAGIGNIYADEILWRSGIHPLSIVSKIPDKKFQEIFRAMKKILKESIRLGGDSKSDYRNIYGEKGNFQKKHRAYGREGLRCPKRGCLGIIKRISLKGRGTHFCPVHQEKF